MVLTVRAGAYEAHSADGSVRFHRHGVGAGWHYEVLDVAGRNPLADQSCDRFAGAAAEAAGPLARPAGQRLSPRLRAGRPVLRRADGARPLRRPHRRPQLRGPGRAPGRARLARRRPGPGAVRAGRPGRAGRRHWSTASCRLVDVAPTLARLMGLPHRPAAGLNGLHRADAYLARQDGDALTDLLDGDAAPPRGRLPARRVQPQRALPAGGLGPGAQRRPADGHGHGLPPRRDGRHADGHAGQPHVAPHRRATPATTASSTTPGRTAPPARSSSPTRRPPGRPP